jgi:hypothetical protein
MRELPSVISATYVSGYMLRVTFHDRTVKVVDFEPWLNGPIFEPVRDLAFFKQFMIAGGTVSWPNGADIAPETLYSYTEHTASVA